MSDNSNILGQINADTPHSPGSAQPAGAPGQPQGESGWAQTFGPDPQQAQPAAPQPQSAQDIATTGKDMLKAARAGQFAVEPEYAQRLIKVLKDEIAKLHGLDSSVDGLARGVKLGATPAALKVAPFYQYQVAGTGPHSFAVNHYLGIQCLDDIVHAIEVAMDNYRHTDDGSAGHFKHLD